MSKQGIPAWNQEPEGRGSGDQIKKLLQLKILIPFLLIFFIHTTTRSQTLFRALPVAAAGTQVGYPFVNTTYTCSAVYTSQEYWLSTNAPGSIRVSPTPHFQKTGGDGSVTITFSRPVGIDSIVLYMVDFQSPTAYTTLTVSGGTATRADFVKTNHSSYDPMNYNTTTGQLTTTGVPSSTAFLRGVAGKTATTLTFATTGVNAGDYLGYAIAVLTAEECGNGFDDDYDGLVDENCTHTMPDCVSRLNDTRLGATVFSQAVPMAGGSKIAMLMRSSKMSQGLFDYVIKITDPSGNVVRQKSLGTAASHEGITFDGTIAYTSSNRIIVGGITRDAAQTADYPTFYCLDTALNIIWQRYLLPATAQLYSNNITVFQTGTDEVTFVGDAAITGASGATCIKMKISDGTTIFAGLYQPTTFGHFNSFFDTYKTFDGKQMMPGAYYGTSGTNYVPSMTQLNVDGTIAWSKYYTSLAGFIWSSVNTDMIGSMVSTTYSNFTLNPVIFKTDPLGNIVWAKEYPAPSGYNYVTPTAENYRCNSITRAADDSGFFVCDEISSNNQQDLLLMKIDNNGNVLWTRKIGKPNLNEWITNGHAVFEYTNGLMIVGAQNQGTDQKELLVTASKTDGTTGSCDNSALTITASAITLTPVAFTNNTSAPTFYTLLNTVSNSSSVAAVCCPIEICDDGLDNDLDALADCADADCPCTTPPQDRCVIDGTVVSDYLVHTLPMSGGNMAEIFYVQIPPLVGAYEQDLGIRIVNSAGAQTAATRLGLLTFRDEPLAAIRSSDNGIVMAGRHYDFATNASYPFVMKLNSALAVVWSVRLDVTLATQINEFQELSMDTDGNIIVVGKDSYFGSKHHGDILKLNTATGAEMWSSSSSYTTGSSALQYHSVTKAPDGGWLIAATDIVGANTRPVLIKTNGVGGLMYAKSLSNYTGNNYADRVLNTPDGGSLLIYQNTFGSAGSDDIGITKFDAAGNHVWTKSYGNASSEKIHGAALAPDGTGYYISSSLLNYASVGSGMDIMLAKINLDGTVAWAKIYGAGGSDLSTFGSTLTVTSSNIMVVGVTSSYGLTTNAGYLIKTDLNGNASCDFRAITLTKTDRVAPAITDIITALTTLNNRTVSPFSPVVNTQAWVQQCSCCPIASFTVGGSCNNRTFTSTSTLALSNVTTYSWNFGDGTTSALANPTKVYTAAGTYTVTLTVGTDNPLLACASSSTQTITVAALPSITAAGVATPCAGTALTLSSTPSGGTAPYTYSWSGPGSFTAATQNISRPAMTLAFAGIYTVTVTSAGGCIATSTRSVSVQDCGLAINTCATALNSGTTKAVKVLPLGNGNFAEILEIVGHVNSISTRPSKIDAAVVVVDAGHLIQSARMFSHAGNFVPLSAMTVPAVGAVTPGIIVWGYSSDNGAGTTQPTIMRLDYALNIIWSRTTTSVIGSAEFWEAILDTDGNILVNDDECYAAVGCPAGLYKINAATGADIWGYSYQPSTSFGFAGIAKTSDGGFIVPGISYSPYYPSLTKMDGSGNITWTKVYAHPGAWEGAGESALEAVGGGFIVLSRNYPLPSGIGDMTIMKTDASGNIIWYKNYGGSGSEGPVGLYKLNDNTGYIALGYTNSSEYGTVGIDALAFKIDLNGNVVWAHTYGGSGTDLFYGQNAFTENANGLIFNGYSSSFGGSKSWIVATDLTGNGQCGEKDITITPVNLTPAVFTLTPVATARTLQAITITPVSVTASSQCGCCPTANFTTAGGCNIKTFTSTSTIGLGAVGSFLWSFGDGTTSTAANPSKTYAAAGTYSVKLVVGNGNPLGECKDSITYSITVPPFLTSASLSSNSPICTGNTINLTSAATGGTTPYNYAWTTPDAASLGNIQNPTRATATSPMAGIYTVTISDANTCTATATTTVVSRPQIVLSTPIVSACINHPLADVATLQVNVSWTGTATDTIEVNIYGQTERIFLPAGATSPQTVSFTIPADGTTANWITANWRGKPTTCTPSTTYNAPVACSNDSTNCKILYLCGQEKPLEADAWDHGFINYLDAINGTKTVTPILTKPDAIGFGTYDPMNPLTALAVNLNDYNLIVISATTENDISTDLVAALKNYIGSILLSNYLIVNDLGMANTEASAQFQTFLYTNNTSQSQIYNYNNIYPLFTNIFTRGNYLSNADAYLWTNAGEQVAAINGANFVYTSSDALPGVSATHGRRVYLGYHMNGVYANQQNLGVSPAPVASYFSPARHLTLVGKTFFDQAIIAASIGCNIEDCDDGIDNDGDSFTDCADSDCPAITITTNPANATICFGGTHTFNVTATPSTPTLFYQWQYNTGSSTSPVWANVVANTPNNSVYASSTTTPMTVSGNIAAGVYEYRVVVSNASGCVAYSNPAKLTIVADPLVSIAGNVLICTGGSTVITATSSGGAPSCAIQWQSSTDGTTFSDIVGAIGVNYTTQNLGVSVYYKAKLVCSESGCCN